jgi:hypothetical protein
LWHSLCVYDKHYKLAPSNTTLVSFIIMLKCFYKGNKFQPISVSLLYQPDDSPLVGFTQVSLVKHFNIIKKLHQFYLTVLIYSISGGCFLCVSASAIAHWCR